MPVPFSKRTRYLALAAIIGGLLYALLFYTPPHGGLWTQVFLNSLHVPVFGLIAVSIYALWHPEKSLAWRVGTAFAAACTLGLLSEIAQIATSRDASLEDFIADCLGAGGFLGVAIAVHPGRSLSWSKRTAAVAFGLVLLGWALAPLAAVTAVYVERNQKIPVIFSADSVFGRRLIRAQNIDYKVVKPSAGREPHAEISFLDAPWPGVAFHDVWPDWRSYTTLVIDLAVAGETPLTLNLRVHDDAHRRSNQFHDRFTRDFQLNPGRHTLRVSLTDLRAAPRNREMDLSRISELIIFVTRAEAGRSIRLYGIRLE